MAGEQSVCEDYDQDQSVSAAASSIARVGSSWKSEAVAGSWAKRSGEAYDDWYGHSKRKRG